MVRHANAVIAIMATGMVQLAPPSASAYSTNPTFSRNRRTLLHAASCHLFPSTPKNISSHVRPIFVRNLALVLSATLGVSKQSHSYRDSDIGAEITGLNDMETTFLTSDLMSSLSSFEEPDVRLRGDVAEEDEGEQFWSNKEERLMLPAEHEAVAVIHHVDPPPDDPFAKELYWSNKEERLMLPSEHEAVAVIHHVDPPPDDPFAKELYWSNKEERLMLPVEHETRIYHFEDEVEDPLEKERLDRLILCRENERKARIMEASKQPKSPEVEASLKEKYASIKSLEERVFTILLDLGMIEITGDEY